ncbi:ankyrin repeat domain-containing protein [Paracoccaceae bacterium]|nr:ankyrin repeat domain-containing protein [Paracoccaceae bacterium]
MQKQFLVIITVCLVLTGCMSSGPEPSLVSGNCTNLCSERWWKTATLADLKTEIKIGENVNATNTDGNSPLHFAASYDNKSAYVKTLINAGAKLSRRDKYGNTPMFYAVIIKNNDTVKLLLDAGASPDIRNINGQTTVHVAVISNNIVGLKSLLDAGADPMIRDNTGESPLGYANNDLNTDAMIAIVNSKNYSLN